jgi:hypothetical protein
VRWSGGELEPEADVSGGRAFRVGCYAHSATTVSGHAANETYRNSSLILIFMFRIICLL